ncbi:chloride channel protein [Streptococcus hongkongensis]
MIKTINQHQNKSIQTILILSVLALIIGLLVGLLDFVFGSVLLQISEFRSRHLILLLPFLALAGLVMTTLYQKFSGRASKGMGLVFHVGQGKEKDLPLVLVPLVIISTWLTHLFGGSAGREGVAVQIGATVSHYCHSWVKVENSSRIFLVLGMASGFAGLFQTPIAAVFFALEVLVLNNLSYLALFPALIAAFTASGTSHVLGLEKFTAPIGVVQSISPIIFLKLIILGTVFGLVGNSFAILLSRLKAYLVTKIPNPYVRIASIGLCLTLLLLILHLGRYTGLGTNLIANAFSGQAIYTYDWLLKLLLTVLTISAGFQGGEVTPLFAIGASLGFVLAPLFGLPVALVAALGYIAVFASATNTMLAPIFIGLEVFGGGNFLAYFLVVATAYILNRKNSIYGGQELMEW